MIKENLSLYIKRIILGLIILLVSLLQNTGKLMPHIFGTSIMLLIPTVICISMFENEIASIFFGLLGGLLWDSISAGGHYYHTIMLTVFAFLVSLAVRRIVRNTLVTSLLLTLIITFLHNTLYWALYVLIPHSAGAAHIYFSFYLLSCLTTSIFGVIVYIIIRAFEKAYKV